jgi:hypothetical protein
MNNITRGLCGYKPLVIEKVPCTSIPQEKKPPPGSGGGFHLSSIETYDY